MTLPARRPSASPTRASGSRSRVTSSASMSRSVGKSGRGQQLEGPLEAVGVVDERPDDRQLVQHEPVGVEGRALDAGADQGQGAAPGQLVEAGLHGRLLARALEHDVERRARPAARAPRAGSAPGGPVPTPRSAPRSAASCRRRSPGSTATTSVIPMAPQGGDGEGADGAGPDHEHPVTGLRPRAGDAVEGHGQGLGQRRVAGPHTLGHPQQRRGPHSGCSGRRHRH